MSTGTEDSRAIELAFVSESNRIEGITRPATVAEMDEFYRFMDLKEVTVADLEQFVSVFQPGGVLRDKPGLDVVVGNHFPPRGSKEIRVKLERLLEEANKAMADDLPQNKAWEIHVAYEFVHPFTDGNGRSGRMLWAWMYRDLSLGFLHRFYYQTLQNIRP